MSTYHNYVSSGVRTFFKQTDATAIKNHALVILLNPGTTGTASPGANTASALFAGISTGRGPVDVGDGDGAAEVDGVGVDIGGGMIDVDHDANLTGVEVGEEVFVTGEDSVDDSGNVSCGRIVRVLATGAGTSRVRIQCKPFAGSVVGAEPNA